MYQFFETIRYQNKIPNNLLLHQQRVDNTLLKAGGTSPISLANIIASMNDTRSLDDIIYKCRIMYDTKGNFNISFEPYNIKTINSISIQDIGDNKYDLKYVDRNWINELLAKSGSDEIILTHNGIVKDASYANLAFLRGEDWITPTAPLLAGTKRAQLLNLGKLISTEIKVNDLKHLKFAKLINAMIPWDEAPIIPLHF